MSRADKVFVLVLLCFCGAKCENAPDTNRSSWASCVPKASFTDCDSSPDNPLIRSNTLPHPLEIRIVKGCRTSDIYNYWSLVEKDSGSMVNAYSDRKDKATVLIAKYQLKPGDYILIAHVRESPMLNVDVWIEVKCYIRITSPCPLPIISGGQYKTAPIGATIDLKASATLNCKLAVRYTWKCASRRNSPSCRDLSGRRGELARIVIDGKVGDEYIITLTARIDKLPSRTFTQIIRAHHRNSPAIAISGRKNILPTGSVFSDPVVPIYMKAKCYFACRLIEQYIWSLRALTPSQHTAQEIMENGTYTGADKEILIIKPNWFGFDEVFEVHLATYGGGRKMAETMVLLNMTTNVGGRSKCTSSHNGAEGLQRMYTIKCQVPEARRPVKYKLQQMIPSPLTGEPLAHTLVCSDTPVFTVRLGSSGNYKTQTLSLIVTDDTMVTTNTTFQVEVPSPYEGLSPDQVLVKMKHAYMGMEGTYPLGYLLRVGRISEACQIINVIFCETAKFGAANAEVVLSRTTSQIYLLLDLVKVEILETDLEYLLAIVPHTVVGYSKQLYHSKLRSRLCLKIARGFCDVFYKEQYPLTYQGYLELVTILLHRCANYYLDNNYIKPYVFNVPLPEPIPEHIGPLEDYPNYGELLDDLSVEDLKEIVKNAIGIINIISEIYARTFIYGEPRVHINYTANTSIDITYAEEKDRRSYSDDQVQVRLPDHLGPKAKDTVRIVYTALPVAAFFWDKTSGNMSNRIINIKIYDPRKKEITELPSSVHLYFDLNENQDDLDRYASFEMPLEDEEWTEEYVGKYMKLFRVEVEAFSSLMSTIDDIEPVKTLMIAVTKNRKPTKKDFVIRGKQGAGKFYIFNTTDTDTWYYVGLLPREEEIKKMIVRKRSSFGGDYGIQFNDDYTVSLNRLYDETINISFTYGFTTFTCKEWSGDMWGVHHCNVGRDSDDQRMHCICSQVSTLAADVKHVKLREENPLVVKYKLTVVINPIIAIVTAVIIGIYCIMVCFVYLRKEPMRLYFLSDNLEEDRYAYLLIIQTGAYRSCSTTSNVTIKLYGSKISSKPHVLNYPDPDMRILQDGGEDWFILTARYHLGDITRIQLWYDAVGPKYTWYCEYVKIHDLQTYDQWFFGASKRFTVAKEDMHNFTLYPSDEEKWVPERKIYTNLHFYWSADHLWNIFDRRDDNLLPYVDRVTILASQALFTLAYALAILEQPTFRLKDGLGEDNFDIFHYIFLHIVGISIVVFVLFCPFSIVLRYTPKEREAFKQENVILPRLAHTCCWIILILISCFSVAYLIWFGFWIPQVTSTTVLIIAVFSLYLNAILLENVKLFAVKYLSGIYIKRFRRSYVIDFKAVITETERQRKFIYTRRLGKYALRPYLTHLYKPLTSTRFKKISSKKAIEYNIGESASDMAFFYLYTSMLFFLLLIKLNSLTYINSKHVLYMAMHGSNRNLHNAYRVKTLEDLYLYLNNTLAHMLHPMSWYGDWNVSESGLLDDYNTKILGVARIRQKRVRDTHCNLASYTRIVNVSICQNEYGRSVADRSDVGLSKSMWAFQEGDSENIHIGQLHTYSASGFIVKLGRNLNNTFYIIQMMKSNSWLDTRTRAVFVEFWTYNANQNLFSAVTILFERSATQCMAVNSNILTLELMHSTSTMEVIAIVIFATFCILIFRLLLKYIRKLIKYHLRMFTRVFNLWEMTIIVTNITIVVLYMKQFQEHDRVFDQLRDAKHNEFVSYFRVMYAYKRIQIATAILFAFAIARGITFMKFVEAFRVFEQTLRFSYKSYAAMILYSTIVVMMFAMSGHIMFGGHSRIFSNLELSMLALFKRSVGLPSEFEGKSKQAYNKMMGYVFFFLFSFTILVMKNIFVATTMLYHRQSRLFLSKVEVRYSFYDYLSDKWRYYSQLWKRHVIRCRLKGGEDFHKAPVIATPKDDTFRYANCVFMSDAKLQYMTLISRAVIRSMFFKRNRQLGDNEYEAMREIAISCFWDEEVPTSASLFFINQGKDGKMRFISNNKLLEMEYWLNNVLTRASKRDKPHLEDTTSLQRMQEIVDVMETVDAVLGNISVKSVKRKRNFEEN